MCIGSCSVRRWSRSNIVLLYRLLNEQNTIHRLYLLFKTDIAGGDGSDGNTAVEEGVEIVEDYNDIFMMNDPSKMHWALTRPCVTGV